MIRKAFCESPYKCFRKDMTAVNTVITVDMNDATNGTADNTVASYFP